MTQISFDEQFEPMKRSKISLCEASSLLTDLLLRSVRRDRRELSNRNLIQKKCINNHSDVCVLLLWFYIKSLNRFDVLTIQRENYKMNGGMQTKQFFSYSFSTDGDN